MVGRVNSAEQVAKLIDGWKAEGLGSAEIVKRTAEACLGWSYVWGSLGEICSPGNRKSYAERSVCPSGEAAEIRMKCQRLNGSSGSCVGCQWYPGDTTRIFDCRGFTRWCLKQVGFTLQGAGATSQWNNAANWDGKGELATMPDTLCCVFKQNKDGKTMDHTGFHVGGGRIIHCSGTVKAGSTSERGWTHWAVPKISGVTPAPTPTPTPTHKTIRRGDRGEDVKYCQQLLMALGYNVGATGADGIFGAKTETAVKAFQNNTGLTADGIVGPKTWEALENGQPAPAPLLWTVTIRNLQEDQADEIISQYGGTKTAEGSGA